MAPLRKYGRLPGTLHAPLGWKSAGRRVIFVNPTATSIDCHACGARCGRPRQDTVVCPLHGNLDADLNGIAWAAQTA